MANLTGSYYAAEGSGHGYGTQWLIGGGDSPETFEAVAEVRTITFGNMTTVTFDRTHLRSPNAHTELAAGLRSSGPFTMVCNWRPQHESQSRAGGGSDAFGAGGTLGMWMSREERNHKIVLPDWAGGLELPFRGVITGYQPGEVGTGDGPNLTVQVQPLNGEWHSELP